MGFIKFLFVLLLVVPVAVVMIYLINNLNGILKSIVKNDGLDKRDKASEKRDDKGAKQESKAGGRFSPQYSRDIEKGRTSLVFPERKFSGGYDSGHAYSDSSHSKSYDTEKNVEDRESPKDSRSKRKRRKERRKKKKVTESEG